MTANKLIKSKVDANAVSVESTALLRSGDLFGPLVLFSEKQPPNDYSYKCVIVFRDGYETLSDGGSVHDACVKSGIAYAWREVLPNIKDQAPAE